MSFEVLACLKPHSASQMTRANDENNTPVCFVRHNMISDTSKSIEEDLKSVRHKLKSALTKKIDRS